MYRLVIMNIISVGADVALKYETPKRQFNWGEKDSSGLSGGLYFD